MNKPVNPLQKHFRAIKLYTRLPSGTDYYSAGVVELTDSGEVGILPMTSTDEVLLKNPEGLLNGESLISLLRSCVPAVKDPKRLVSNDIDALVVAIKHASFEKHTETRIDCPKCHHTNNFGINLAHILDNMSMLEKEYIVQLDTGLDIYVRPFSFDDLLKGFHTQFEQAKLAKLMTSDTYTDEQKMSVFSKQIGKLTKTNTELLINSIEKIVVRDTNETVVDRTFINEFINDCNTAHVNKIDALLKEINNVGIEKNLSATCENCGYTWKADMEFNPVNFS